MTDTDRSLAIRHAAQLVGVVVVIGFILLTASMQTTGTANTVITIIGPLTVYIGGAIAVTQTIRTWRARDKTFRVWQGASWFLLATGLIATLHAMAVFVSR